MKDFLERMDIDEIAKGRNRYDRMAEYQKQIDEYSKEKNMTKIEKILMERNLSQGDLMRMIARKSGFKIGRDRISKICTGRMKNYTLETAVMIAEALEVPVDNIIELKDIKKENKY